MEQYILEKNIWTQDDFEVMGWHDANIYGMIIEKDEEQWQANLIFDIDYIFKWVHPVPPQEYFSFWVAPCTLIFREVYDVKMSIDHEGSIFDLLEIAELELISKQKVDTRVIVHEWHIRLQEGGIQFKSLGFKQIVRKKPIYTDEQVLSLDKRGGISFSKQAFEEKE